MLGLLYDVHGNLPALDAVLADAEAVGADRWLLGGDYALFGAWPAETVTRLKGLDATWIRGNGERWTGSPDDAPEAVRGAIEYSRKSLGPDLVQELAALPESWRDDDTLYCHGSPASDVRSFRPDPADDEPELLARLSDGVTRLVFGHTHLPFRRKAAGGPELINPGSVGMPWDGDPRAAYAILPSDGSVVYRRVAYDHRASADAVRERLGEAGEVPARRIERASFDVS